MNLIKEAVSNVFIVELGFNLINSKYITKSTTVEPRQYYFTHDRIKNQQSKAVISMFLFI